MKIGTIEVLPEMSARARETAPKYKISPERVEEFIVTEWRVRMIQTIDCIANEMQRSKLGIPSAYDKDGNFLGGLAVLSIADCG